MEEIKCSCCGFIAYKGYNTGTYINDTLMYLYKKGWEEIEDKLFCDNCIKLNNKTP